MSALQFLLVDMQRMRADLHPHHLHLCHDHITFARRSLSSVPPHIVAPASRWHEEPRRDVRAAPRRRGNSSQDGAGVGSRRLHHAGDGERVGVCADGRCSSASSGRNLQPRLLRCGCSSEAPGDKKTHPQGNWLPQLESFHDGFEIGSIQCRRTALHACRLPAPPMARPRRSYRTSTAR